MRTCHRCVLQLVLPERRRLPVVQAQRLADDLIAGRVLTEWQLMEGGSKAGALRSKLKRVYKDLNIVRFFSLSCVSLFFRQPPFCSKRFRHACFLVCAV